MKYEQLLETWHTRVRRAQIGHFKSAVRCERKHLWIGLPAVILSTIVGSSVFASLQEKSSAEFKILVAFLSILAAILSAIQTFLRHSERAERHRVAGTAFGGLKKELEFKSTFPPQAPQEQEQYANSFLKRWNRLVKNSPTTDESVFEKIKTLKHFGSSVLSTRPEPNPAAPADQQASLPGR